VIRSTRTIRALLLIAALFAAGCGEEAPEPARPNVIKVMPDKAQPGELISIWGENLGTKGSLTSGGSAVVPRVWTPSRIEFAVPPKQQPGVMQIALKIGETALEPVKLEVKPPPPQVDDIEPFRSKVGEWATVKGSNFGATRGPEDKVLFYGSEVKEIAHWKPTEIKFKIPKFDQYGTVQVVASGSPSNAVGYRLIKPEPAEISPYGQLPGRTCVVKGKDFGEETGKIFLADVECKVVKWGDIAVEFEVAAKVPAGAEKPLKVVNANGQSFPVMMNVLGSPNEGPIWKGEKESRFIDMTLDANDFPHIMWYEDKTHCPALMRWNGLRWELGLVHVPFDKRTGVLPNAGWYPSLLSEPDGSEYATFYNLYYSQLQFGRFDGSTNSWTFDYVDTQSKNCGVNSCIRRAPNGDLVIAYFDQERGNLKLARGKPGAWTLETVDAGSQCGLTVNMEIDKNGVPHLAYLDFALKHLKYATWDAAAKKWSTEYITGTGKPEPHNHVGPPHGPAFPSLELDSKGRVHVAYLYRQGDIPKKSEEDEDGVRHAVRKDGAWVHKLIEKGDEIGFAPQLSIAKGDKLVVGYIGRKDETVRWAVSDGNGQWKVKSASAPGLVVAEEPAAAEFTLGSDGKGRFIYWTEKPSEKEKTGKKRELNLKIVDIIKD
jgi:hypothetical protein